MSDIEIEDDCEEECAEDTSIYISKSGVEFSNKSPRQGRRRRVNILHATPGPINDDNIFSTIKEAFLLFMSRDIVNIIVEETNREAHRVFLLWNEANPSRKRNWKDVNHAEIYAVIGILIAAGKIHGIRTSIFDLWGGLPAFQQPFFTAAMSRDRFLLTLKFISFDDRSPRLQRIEETKDKLQAFRKVFDLFESTLPINCCPYESLLTSGWPSTEAIAHLEFT